MTIEHLSFGYSKRKNRVLNDCSLHLEEGKIYGLLGKNGVGKSTLLYLMTGLLTPTEGHACLNGTDARLRRPDTLSDFFLIPEEFDAQRAVAAFRREDLDHIAFLSAFRP